MDGNDLLSKCRPFFDDFEGHPDTTTTPNQNFDSGYCVGYVAGVLDLEATWDSVEEKSSKIRHFCVPGDGIPGGQVLRILKKWLDKNPEKLHWRADSIIHAALLEAFPCKE